MNQKPPLNLSIDAAIELLGVGHDAFHELSSSNAGLRMLHVSGQSVVCRSSVLNLKKQLSEGTLSFHEIGWLAGQKPAAIVDEADARKTLCCTSHAEFESLLSSERAPRFLKMSDGRWFGRDELHRSLMDQIRHGFKELADEWGVIASDLRKTLAKIS